MNVLSIGNSFSQDAQTYLYAISRAEKKAVSCVNLYIGGCSLARHYRNIMGDKREYEIQVCGRNSGFYTSVKEALLSRKWDAVTIQQASFWSGDFKNYAPYLEEIVAFIRRMAPEAKLYVHETWGYADDHQKLPSLNCSNMEEMSNKVFAAYEKAAQMIHADGVIPSGHGMLALKKASGASVHRDGGHAGLGAPRYMLGCIWYETLTGKPVTNENFTDFDVEVTPEEAALARKVAHEVVAGFVKA